MAELETHPVNCVTWAQARRLCQAWEDGDLPSEAQWEKAARGTDGRIFPWGDEPVDCTRANWDENGPYNEDTGTGEGEGCHHGAEPITWEAGHLAGSVGDSAYGLKDMAGNVTEWVIACFDAGFYSACAQGDCQDPVNEGEDSCPHTVRGGSAETWGTSNLAAVQRGVTASINGDFGLNFRCVKSSPGS